MVKLVTNTNERNNIAPQVFREILRDEVALLRNSQEYRQYATIKMDATTTKISIPTTRMVLKKLTKKKTNVGIVDIAMTCTKNKI